MHRAGGTVCGKLSNVASEFHSNIVDVDPCPRHVDVHTASVGKTPQKL